MEIDGLCSDLEHHFELDELKEMAEHLLGVDPGQVGGRGTKASFARALVLDAAGRQALEALSDAVVAERPDIGGAFATIAEKGFDPGGVLAAQTAVGDFVVLEALGKSSLSRTYLAEQEGRQLRLKVLSAQAMLDRPGVERLFTTSRRVGGVMHAGLPRNVRAGELAAGVFGVVHNYVDGELMSDWLKRVGPRRFTELPELLRAILEPLVALHESRIVHGNLKLENLLMFNDESGSTRVVLLDAGSNSIRQRGSFSNGVDNRFCTVSSPATVSPEQIRGEAPTPSSDVYAFGAILYELLSGRAPFGREPALDALLGHLTMQPPSLGADGAGEDVENFVERLLAKEALHRPGTASELMQSVDSVARASLRVLGSVTADEVSRRLSDLLSRPWDEEEAAALEATADAGADADQLAEGFRWISEQLNPDEGIATQRAQKSMLFRAARVYEKAANRPDAAEALYSYLLDVDENDASAGAALERVRRSQGKHEDIIEGLLARAERSESAIERGSLWSDIGGIYKKDLRDDEQALVAFTQALTEDPDEDEHALQVERLAGTEHAKWEEVLTGCMDAIQLGELPQDSSNRLLARMGGWYVDRVNRPDLALPMYNQILTTDPANDQALSGLASIYRKAQQWAELGNVLTKRAETAAPGLRRDLQAEAAQVLETRLNNPEAARDLYQAILDEDPGHKAAAQALARLYAAAGDNEAYARVLEQRAQSVGGEEKVAALCEVAEVYEDQLDDMAKAASLFEAALLESPTHLDALKGLDRILNRQGRYPELIENLERQLALAVTARQKINLYQRIAGIHEEEFLDHTAAARACENVLDLDAEHQEALTAVARHYRALERWSDLVSVLERHVELLGDPSLKARKAIELGAVFEKLGQPERAIEAYEQAVSAEASNSEALGALAKLRANAGDAERALEAIDSLAEDAKTPKERADHLLQAAELLESRGDREGAIIRYKAALDANPDDRSLSGKLRAAFVRAGDVEAAVDLLDAEVERTEGDGGRARLSGELAFLCLEHLHDHERAYAAAKFAVNLDPTNLYALVVLGHIAYDDAKYVEASKRYQPIIQRVRALEKEQAARVYTNYIDALVQIDEAEKAVVVIDDLLAAVPDDVDVWIQASELVSKHGPPHRALDVSTQLLNKFAQLLGAEETAKAYYRQGEAARKMQDHERARESLDAALDHDPSFAGAYGALARLYEDQEDWEEAIGMLYKQQECSSGEERGEVLTQIGDLAAKKLGDVDYAANIYLTALGERPDDRKIMMKLMQLYGEAKDWDKLVGVILRLAELVEDKKQKAKYLHTASMVASRELSDLPRAMDLLDKALEEDPGMVAALDEALSLRQRTGDHEAVKDLLKLKITRATDAGDKKTLLQCLDELAALYHEKLGRPERAIEVHEQALQVDPNPEQRQSVLLQLYLEDPHRYMEKASSALFSQIRSDPFQPEPYKALRRMYTELRRPDAAYCACQALCVLNRADPDEVRFFNRMHSDDPAAAQDRLTEKDFNEILVHPDVDRMLSALFVLIEPSVVQSRAQGIEALGYSNDHVITVDAHPYGLVYTLNYASEVIGIKLPPMVQNQNDPGALAFLNTQPPGIVCGQAALGGELPAQMGTFIAARHLACYRPGFYVRQVVSTSAGLKSWLFAAIKVITPKFPVAKDLEGPVSAAVSALERNLTPKLKDHLAQVVSKLLSDGASLDIKRWMSGVDYTIDRAGFVLCDDLQTAIEVIRAGDDPSVLPDSTARVKALVAYSVSEEYFSVRERLRIAL